LQPLVQKTGKRRRHSREDNSGLNAKKRKDINKDQAAWGEGHAFSKSQMRPVLSDILE